MHLSPSCILPVMRTGRPIPCVPASGSALCLALVYACSGGLGPVSDPYDEVMVYGTSREEALARVQALALHTLADRIEHGEADAQALLSVSFTTSEAA
jgi:hypothetical protein